MLPDGEGAIAKKYRLQWYQCATCKQRRGIVSFVGDRRYTLAQLKELVCEDCEEDEIGPP